MWRGCKNKSITINLLHYYTRVSLSYVDGKYSTLQLVSWFCLYMFCKVQQMCSYSKCADVLNLKFFNLNSKFSILTPNSYYIIKLYPMYICCRLSDLFKDYCHSSTHNFSQFLMIQNDVFWKVKNVKSTSTIFESYWSSALNPILNLWKQHLITTGRPNKKMPVAHDGSRLLATSLWDTLYVLIILVK